MIRINLIKEEKRKRGFELKGIDLKRLKEYKLEDLVRGDRSFYVLSGLLWIALGGFVAYYFAMTQKRSALMQEISRLEEERRRIEAQHKKFLEEKQGLEAEINRIKGMIADIEKGKDILVGLKSYYAVFNDSLRIYSSKLPSGAWLSEYKQSLDLNGGVMKVEMGLASLDPDAIGSYGRSIKTDSSVISISNLERKAGQYGFEFYTAKLSVERQP